MEEEAQCPIERRIAMSEPETEVEGVVIPPTKVTPMVTMSKEKYTELMEKVHALEQKLLAAEDACQIARPTDGMVVSHACYIDDMEHTLEERNREILNLQQKLLASEEAIGKMVEALKDISGHAGCALGETPHEISPIGCLVHRNGLQCRAAEALTTWNSLKGETEKA